MVTRSPSLDASDALVLPILSERPPNMSPEDWDFLKNLHFGCIIFSNRGDAQYFRSLPQLIADGDLDGDLYLTVWDPELLSYFRADQSHQHPSGLVPGLTGLEDVPEHYTNLFLCCVGRYVSPSLVQQTAPPIQWRPSFPRATTGLRAHKHTCATRKC